MPPPAIHSRSATTLRDGRDWLSLGPASRLVGIDPDTLRRWADHGRLPSFLTPGRHRRFDRRDLERVLVSRHQSAVRRPLSALGATPDRMSRAYARSYRDSTDERAIVGERFAGSDRDGFRSEGRRLVSALLAYLDASSARARARSESEAVEAVRATGARLAAAGAGLDEATSAFIAARRPFFAELAALGRRPSLDVVSLTTLYDDAVALLDRLLLEFLSAFKSPLDPSSPPQPQRAPR